MCAVIGQATVLLHEVTHLCGMSHPGDNPDTAVVEVGACQEVFLTQQSFLWGAMHRYPDAAASECCAAKAESIPGDGGPIGDFSTDCSCSTPRGGPPPPPFGPPEIEYLDFEIFEPNRTLGTGGAVTIFLDGAEVHPGRW
jgi:hypothetical protein